MAGVQHSLQWVTGVLLTINSLQSTDQTQQALSPWERLEYSTPPNQKIKHMNGWCTALLTVSDRCTPYNQLIRHSKPKGPTGVQHPLTGFPQGSASKSPTPSPFSKSEAKTEKRRLSVSGRGLTIAQRSWWWATTMSPSCQTRSVATQPAPEAPETSIPAHRPVVNTAFLATSLCFNPFPALITSYDVHAQGFPICYTASHLNSECLCMFWRSLVLEAGHPA